MSDWDKGKHPRGRGGRFDETRNSPPAGELAMPASVVEDEMLDVESRFGVSPQQVERDRLISHALGAIAGAGAIDVVFFGGTALSRTHLPDLRLSEDIDLIALGDRREVGDRIEAELARALQREFGVVTFTPHIRETRHPDPAVMTAGGISVQIQLLSSEGYPDWPTELLDVEQRYSDAPRARMRVLTAPAFVASKLASWNDRESPRDLYDLWALAVEGRIDEEAAALFGRYGPYTSAKNVPFVRIPTRTEWDSALGHQCVVKIGPAEAARVVRAALEDLP